MILVAGRFEEPPPHPRSLDHRVSRLSQTSAAVALERRMPIKYYVGSFAEYIEAIFDINSKTKSTSGAAYRGQSNSNWSVSSGLSRYCKNNTNQLAAARDAFRKFDAERHAYYHLSSNNPWDVLAL